MPVDYRAPNINARTLGSHLQRIREALELSYDQAAEALGCDVTWLIRLETGFETATPDQVRRMLDRYEVPPRHRFREVLVDLASRPDGPPWLAEHVGRMKALVRDLLTVESESPFIRTFGIQLVPELVRTEPYARLCLSHRHAADEIDREWDLLNSRQRHRPGGRRRVLQVIVDETAVTMPTPDPEIMRGQLRHLLGLPEDGRSSVRVVPMSAGAHAGLGGSFDVLEFPEAEDRVSMVHSALGIDLAGADLTDTWRLLEEAALSPDESRDMLVQIMAAFPDPT